MKIVQVRLGGLGHKSSSMNMENYLQEKYFRVIKKNILRVYKNIWENDHKMISNTHCVLVLWKLASAGESRGAATGSQH